MGYPRAAVCCLALTRVCAALRWHSYWFHPPDTSSYERPYRAHGFWRREWRRTLRLHADGAE